MSDYLTNLVVRSFSPMASVQPMGAPLYVAPEIFQGPVAEFSDPFAEAAISDDDVSAEAQEVNPQRKRSRDKLRRLEAPIEEAPIRMDEAPIRMDQESFEGPLANSRSVTITPLRREFPGSAESATSRGQPNPSPSDESPAKLEEAPRIPTGLETSMAGVLTSAEKSSPEPAKPIRKTSGARAPLVDPGLRPSPMERSEVFPSVPPGIAHVDESGPEENIVRAKRVARKPNDNAYTFYPEPIDTGLSTRHLVKRPPKAVSLSPQTSPADLERAVSRAPDRPQLPAVVESVIERTTAPIEVRQQIKASLTTLIPKTSTQPLLPVNVKTRPSLQSRHEPDETAAQVPLSETIINVAIGRIEVRATPFESPRRKRQSNGPRVMNLDDYLQLRSRGNR